MGVVLLAAVTLAATPARAHCGDDPDAPLPYSIWPASEVVAADGVLGFRFFYNQAEAGLEYFTVKVLDAEGQPVAGTLTLHADFSTLSWRPETPWVAGASYTVVTFIDTPAWAADVYGAGAGACSTYERETVIAVDAAPLPVPARPPIITTTEHRVAERYDLRSVVCCDGALPAMGPGPGSVPNDVLEVRNGGNCVSRLDQGTLGVFPRLDYDLLPPAEAGNLATRVRWPDGTLAYDPAPTLYEAMCLRLESLDLARGDIFVEERCFGEGLELGDLERDISRQLAEVCEGPRYVCQVAGNQWSDEQCTRWPGGEPFEYVEPLPGANSQPTDAASTDTDEGCGCTTSDIPATAPLSLVALLFLRRRRRAR